MVSVPCYNASFPGFRRCPPVAPTTPEAMRVHAAVQEYEHGAGSRVRDQGFPDQKVLCIYPCPRRKLLSSNSKSTRKPRFLSYREGEKGERGGEEREQSTSASSSPSTPKCDLTSTIFSAVTSFFVFFSTKLCAACVTYTRNSSPPLSVLMASKLLSKCIRTDTGLVYSNPARSVFAQWLFADRRLPLAGTD